MPDEIDLLQWFRGDTPGPDDAAWNRARTALEDALASEPAAPGRPGRRHRSRRRRPSRRVTLATVATAAVAAIAAGLIAAAAQGPPSLAGRLTTSYEPARPLPGSALAARARPGTWQLTSSLVVRGWQENTAGPAPGLLTCPTAATCYIEGDNSKSPRGPVDLNSFYVSTDGAQSWSVLPVPAGVTFTSALACASAADCAAGGRYGGHQPVYLSTSTGGHSWTVRPLPASVGQVLSLTCITATSCHGLASAAAEPENLNLNLLSDAHFIRTSDGGAHVAVVPFPAGTAIQSVSCPTASHCVAVGLYGNVDTPLGPDLGRGVLLTSGDGGVTWQQHAWPHGYGAGPTAKVTCTDASHCAMIGFVERDGTVRDAVGFVSGKDAVQYMVIAFSADGGLTWTARTLPGTIPFPWIEDLTCPATGTCYAVGADHIGQRFGKTGISADSSVVAITHNAGRTWQRVTFAVPATLPAGMQDDPFADISQVRCPLPDACVAIGVSDLGSALTPIYTNHG